MGVKHSATSGAALGLPPWLMEAALDTGPCDRGTALRLLDEWLLRLVWLEHVPVYVRSLLAWRILKRNAFTAASSFTPRDFAREHGGMSGETFYAMGRVGRLCEECPGIGAAFLAGEITFTKMLALQRIATPCNEQEMLEAARSRGGKALDEFVRGKLAAAGKTDTDELDKPAVELVADHGAPRSVFILLAWCQDLLRKMSGHPVSGATVLEHAAAEWLAGPGLPGGGQSPRRWHVRPLDKRDEAGPVAASEASLEWEVSDLLEDLDAHVGLTALPRRFAALLEGLDDCDDRELVVRFIECGRLATPIELALGRLLSAFGRLGLARHTEHRTFARYAKDRLGMSGSRARMLARVDEHYRDDEEIMEAYAAADVNALRLDIARVVATGDHRGEWAHRARVDVVMVKRLEEEVRWAQVERDLRERDDIAPPPLGAALPRVDQQISTQGGLPITAEPVAPMKIVMGEAAAHLVINAIQSATRDEDEPPMLALVRILLHAAATWSQMPKHRNKRFEEDNFTCRHPGCTVSADLHSHHVIGRAQGGGNQHENRVTLCWFDHQVNVHGGRTRVWRDENDVLNWELGRAPGRPPLLVLKGERILARNLSDFAPWVPPAQRSLFTSRGADISLPQPP